MICLIRFELPGEAKETEYKPGGARPAFDFLKEYIDLFSDLKG